MFVFLCAGNKTMEGVVTGVNTGKQSQEAQGHRSIRLSADTNIINTCSEFSRPEDDRAGQCCG